MAQGKNDYSNSFFNSNSAEKSEDLITKKINSENFNWKEVMNSGLVGSAACGFIGGFVGVIVGGLVGSVAGVGFGAGFGFLLGALIGILSEAIRLAKNITPELEAKEYSPHNIL